MVTSRSALPFAVRPATPDDAHGISAVRVEGWRAAYAGLIDQRLLDGLDVERDAANRREFWDRHHERPGSASFVAVDAGSVIGWAAVGPAAEDSGLTGHGQLFALYALPDRWSTGVGHALLARAEQSLVDAGFDSGVLFVLLGNDRAANFYERHGWREDGFTHIDDRYAGGLDVQALQERRRVRNLRERVDP